MDRDSRITQARTEATGGDEKTERIPLAKPVFTQEMADAAAEALLNERAVLGESVFKFEEEFARYCGTRHAVSVSSGTAALQLTLEALGLRQPEKEVVTSPMSFIATANAVRHAGASVRFADVTSGTGLLDPSAVAKRARSAAALIPVHLYGTPAPMHALREAVGDDVAVIEDACQAHGASIQNRRAGSLGTAGCFSFYTTKNLTVGGDGGMVTTDDGELADRVRKLRDCGRTTKYEHDVVGYTHRLNTINAAIGRIQLRHLDEWNARRRAIANRYAKQLAHLDDVELPMPPAGTTPAHHLFVVTTPERDALRGGLENAGIQTGIHYPMPIHEQPAYADHPEAGQGHFPHAERHAREAVSLPLFPEMTDEQVDRVVSEVAAFFDEGCA